MREIIFRGISRDTNKFVYGMLMYSVSDTGLVIVETCDIPPSMSDPCGDCINVYHGIIQGTESQYTGLKDKNNKEIYENDIVNIIHPCWSEKCIVEFKDGSFIFRTINKNDIQNTVIPGYTFMREKWKVEVIGNIYDSKNPSN